MRVWKWSGPDYADKHSKSKTFCVFVDIEYKRHTSREIIASDISTRDRAQKMAAAPELLAALKALLKSAPHRAIVSDSEARKYRKAIAKAARAIAKAHGLKKVGDKYEKIR